MIVFENDGVIDVRSITTFGVSSKDNENAIGYFGTGLKYAIAILLRNNCEITVYSDNEKYEFSQERQKIRLDEFNIVTMNNEPLSFTTELGKNWDLWMAFRELYCNTKDERGTTEKIESYDKIDSTNKTIIVVNSKKFEDIFNNLDDFIIADDRKPIFENENIRIFNQSSKSIFYKGIKIGEHEKPCKLSYDIKFTVTLTEDRTAKHLWSLQSDLGIKLSKLHDINILERVFLTGENFQEYDLDVSHQPSEEFFQMCKEAAKSFDNKLSPSAKRAHGEWLKEALIFNSTYALDSIEQQKLEKAINFCKFLGYDVSEYEIKFSEHLGESVLGRAHENSIYISQRVFSQGTKQVAVTLLEEYLHLKHGIEDCTYNMQNYLFDIIGNLGEKLKGEPL